MTPRELLRRFVDCKNLDRVLKITVCLVDTAGGMTGHECPAKAWLTADDKEIRVHVQAGKMQKLIQGLEEGFI